MKDDYFVLQLFRFVWKRHLHELDKIVKIKGWRSAIIKSRGIGTTTVVFLFPFEGPRTWRPKIWRWLPENFELPF